MVGLLLRLYSHTCSLALSSSHYSKVYQVAMAVTNDFFQIFFPGLAVAITYTYNVFCYPLDLAVWFIRRWWRCVWLYVFGYNDDYLSLFLWLWLFLGMYEYVYVFGFNQSSSVVKATTNSTITGITDVLFNFFPLFRLYLFFILVVVVIVVGFFSILYDYD